MCVSSHVCCKRWLWRSVSASTPGRFRVSFPIERLLLSFDLFSFVSISLLVLRFGIPSTHLLLRIRSCCFHRTHLLFLRQVRCCSSPWIRFHRSVRSHHQTSPCWILARGSYVPRASDLPRSTRASFLRRRRDTTVVGSSWVSPHRRRSDPHLQCPPLGSDPMPPFRAPPLHRSGSGWDRVGAREGEEDRRTARRAGRGIDASEMRRFGWTPGGRSHVVGIQIGVRREHVQASVREMNLQGQDWDTVVVRKKAPSGSAAKDKDAINAVRDRGNHRRRRRRDGGRWT